MSVVINGTTGITNDGGYTGDGVVFADTTPANTLVTTTGGNVGVGTSSPSSAVKLDIRCPSSQYMLNLQETDSGNSRRIRFSNFGTANIIESTAGIGATQLAFAVDGTERARISSGGSLLVGATADPTGSITGANIRCGSIFVNRGSTVSGLTSVVNVSHDGNNYYGVMLQNLSTTNSQALTFANSSGTTVGSVVVTTTSTVYNTSSDYRLKEAIAPMTGALAKVQALKPCTYKWKSDGSDGQGFIAHELAEVCPDAVTGEKDAVNEDGSIKPQGIDTSFLVATLTAAIQEQQAIITALTARVAALEGTQP